MLYFADYTPGQASKVWYDEINEYSYEADKFESLTGHFTQMIWKTSTEVGFGYAQQDESTVVVAFYSPAGNDPDTFD